MAKKQFLYENVYNDLKQKIECGDLKPGDKLAVEEDMIAHYGVSAITVKKALNLLAEDRPRLQGYHRQPVSGSALSGPNLPVHPYG